MSVSSSFSVISVNYTAIERFDAVLGISSFVECVCVNVYLYVERLGYSKYFSIT